MSSSAAVVLCPPPRPQLYLFPDIPPPPDSATRRKRSQRGPTPRRSTRKREAPHDLQLHDLAEAWIDAERDRIRAQIRLRHPMSLSARTIAVLAVDRMSVKVRRAHEAFSSAIKEEAEERA